MLQVFLPTPLLQMTLNITPMNFNQKIGIHEEEDNSGLTFHIPTLPYLHDIFLPVQPNKNITHCGTKLDLIERGINSFPWHTVKYMDAFTA